MTEHPAAKTKSASRSSVATATTMAEDERELSSSTAPPLFFQDAVQLDQNLNDQELSLAFFELANVKQVGYRLSSSRCSDAATTTTTTNTIAAETKTKGRKQLLITVQQDASACNQHTGGIVWETSYLLLNYLLHRHHHQQHDEEGQSKRSLGRILEVGAGCGLLGQVLGISKAAKRPVVLTEAPEAMKNLERNVTSNLDTSSKRPHAIVRQLDWMHPERDSAQFPSKLQQFDTILGTDVVFTPELVEPLLATLRYVSKDSTVVYLCLQVRCADSHQLLLDKAPSYGWKLQEISDQLASIPTCAWGLQMECRLLQLLRSPIGKNEETENKKRKKNADDTASSRRKRKSSKR